MNRDKRILLYKIAAALFALVLLLLPQRSESQAQERVLAVVLGLDGTQDNVQVSAQLAVPVASGGNAPPSEVAKGEGASIFEALENLEIGLGRRIDYGHLSTVAFGENVTTADADAFASLLLSSGKSAAGCFLVCTRGSTAADFIEQAQALGSSADAELSRFIAHSKSGNRASVVSVLQFLQNMHGASKAAFLPCVRLAETQSGGGEKSGDQGGGDQSNSEKSGGDQGSGDQGGGGQGGEKGSKKLDAADAVAVYGDGAPIVLEGDPVQGIVWQDKHSRFGLVTLEGDEVPFADVPSVSARLVTKRVRIKVRAAEHNETVYKITAKIKLENAAVLGVQAVQKARKKALEEAFERRIASKLEAALKASQACGVDFLGLKARFKSLSKKGYDTFDLKDVKPVCKIKIELV